MLKYIYGTVLNLCLIFAFTPGFSQKWDVGIQAGTAGYIGDFNPYKVYPTQNIKPSFGIFGSYNFKPDWSARVNFNYIPIEGSDLDSQDPQWAARGLDFKNTIFEGSAVIDFEFYEFRSSRAQTLYTPYIFAGAGVIFHNPTRIGSSESLIDNLVEVSNQREVEAYLRDDPLYTGSAPKPERYSKYVPILPIGAGFKVNLKGEFSVGLQLSYRFPIGKSSDFLDGTSKNYLPYVAVQRNIPTGTGQTAWEQSASGSAAAYADLVGSARGALKGGDRYLTTVLTLSYSIYKWRDPSWK